MFECCCSQVPERCPGLRCEGGRGRQRASCACVCACVWCQQAEAPPLGAHEAAVQRGLTLVVVLPGVIAWGCVCHHAACLSVCLPVWGVEPPAFHPHVVWSNVAPHTPAHNSTAGVNTQHCGRGGVARLLVWSVLVCVVLGGLCGHHCGCGRTAAGCVTGDHPRVASAVCGWCTVRNALAMCGMLCNVRDALQVSQVSKCPMCFPGAA